MTLRFVIDDAVASGPLAPTPLIQPRMRSLLPTVMPDSELPAFVKKLMPVPIEVLASERGRLAFAYDHPLVALTMTVWAFARGSDAVSGELNRGTLEMVLAQPVRRTTVLLTHAAVTVAGALAQLGSADAGSQPSAILIVPSIQ